MITDIDEYFAKGCGRCARFATPACSTRKWRSGLLELRRICLAAGLSEHAKWGHPTYMHAGRNICVLGAFREDFRLSFMNAALMKDPRGILERSGPNTRHADSLRFRDNAAPAAMETNLRTYLAEAMDYAKKGDRPPREAAQRELPDELVEALDADPELAEAFHALTPGRRNSYVVNLAGAKKSETRRARIQRFRDRIIAGKGATER